MASVEGLVVTDTTRFTDWKTARDALRDIRETGKRESKTVVSLGSALLENYSGKLGDEVWSVHEQVVVAALDIGDIKRAELSLEILRKRFSTGKRIKRLEGLLMEGKQEYDEALEFYEEILKDEPTNSLIAKRKIAVYKAQGDIGSAITELTELLEKTMADFEGWSELADLYITQHQYDKAAFCLEELILSNPHNYFYHQRYAEVCYTQNTVDSLEVARKHYSTSLKLHPSNLRSLYGLYQTCVTLARHSKTKKDSKIKNEEIAKWTTSRLLELYQENSTQLKVVEQFLKAYNR